MLSPEEKRGSDLQMGKGTGNSMIEEKKWMGTREGGKKGASITVIQKAEVTHR